MVCVEPRDFFLIFCLSGNVDVSDAQMLEEMTENAFKKGKQCFVFDFSQVNYLTSSGARALLAISKKVTTRNGKMVLARMNDHVLKILDIVGLRMLFEIVDSLEEAIARMG